MPIEFEKLKQMMPSSSLPRKVQRAQDAVANIGRDMYGGIDPIREFKERIAREQRSYADTFMNSQLTHAKDAIMDMHRQSAERLKETLGVMAGADRLKYERQQLNDLERMGAITKPSDMIEQLKALGMGSHVDTMLRRADREADRMTRGIDRASLMPPYAIEREYVVAPPKVVLPNPAKEWIAETRRAEAEQRADLLAGQCLQMSALVSGREFRVTGSDAFAARTSTCIEISVLDETGGTQTVTAHPSAIGILFNILNISDGGSDIVH